MTFRWDLLVLFLDEDDALPDPMLYSAPGRWSEDIEEVTEVFLAFFGFSDFKGPGNQKLGASFGSGRVLRGIVLGVNLSATGMM